MGYNQKFLFKLYFFCKTIVATLLLSNDTSAIYEFEQLLYSAISKKQK